MGTYYDFLEDLEDSDLSEAALVRHYLEAGEVEPARIHLLKQHKESGLNSYDQANLKKLINVLDGQLKLYREVTVMADKYDIEH